MTPPGVVTNPTGEKLRFDGRLLEASGEPGKRRVVVDLIKEGFGNRRDNHYYDAELLQRIAPRFVGAKMYSNHLSESAERALGGLPRDWEGIVGEVLDTWTHVNEAGRTTIRGEAAIYDDRLWNLLSQAPHIVGVSIDASGPPSVTDVREGRQAKVVQDITLVRSLDVVSEAGAGGEIVQIIRESAIDPDDVLASNPDDPGHAARAAAIAEASGEEEEGEGAEGEDEQDDEDAEAEEGAEGAEGAQEAAADDEDDVTPHDPADEGTGKPKKKKKPAMSPAMLEQQERMRRGEIRPGGRAREAAQPQQRRGDGLAPVSDADRSGEWGREWDRRLGDERSGGWLWDDPDAQPDFAHSEFNLQEAPATAADLERALEARVRQGVAERLEEAVSRAIAVVRAEYDELREADRLQLTDEFERRVESLEQRHLAQQLIEAAGLPGGSERALKRDFHDVFFEAQGELHGRERLTEAVREAVEDKLDELGAYGAPTVSGAGATTTSTTQMRESSFASRPGPQAPSAAPMSAPADDEVDRAMGIAPATATT